MNKIFEKIYIFIEQVDKLNKIKSLKFTDINIIIDKVKFSNVTGINTLYIK